MSRMNLLLAALACSCAAGAQSFPICGLIEGWEASGPVRQYNADNLFEYKDGAAEGYLQFGFTRLAGVTCTHAGSTLDIDISEMGSPDAAYGMLMANADSSLPLEKLGMGGQIQKQSALFVKGGHYVELVETPANANADDAALLRALAAKILARLEGRETLPDALGWFVPEDLQSVRAVPESVLGIKQIPRGYAAKYKQGQAFVAEQNSVEAAVALVKILREKFAGAAAQIGDEGFTAQAKYLDGLCIFRKGRVVAGTANFSNAQSALAQATKLAARIP